MKGEEPQPHTEMTSYQGQCGYCDASGCCASPVLPSYEAQLTSGQTSALRSAAIIYNETVRTIRAGGTPRFASHTDYLKYKRAQALASGAATIRCRPPPCDAIRQIEATGCPIIACEPVCPIGETEDTLPFLGYASILNGNEIDPGFLEYIDTVYGGSVTVPPVPEGYLFTCLTVIFYPPICNSTSVRVTSSTPAEITDLGPSSFAEFPFLAGIGGIVIIYPTIEENPTLTITASNSCSSSSSTSFYCFLAGSPVALADGSTKPIEQIVVGDRVIGAFGEINTVTGTISNYLGFVPITNINGEHKTTAPHPHIAVDHTFQCTDTEALIKFAYGRKFPIAGTDGTRDTRIIKGVNPSRIKTLEVGAVLQTLTGPRTVTTLESIRMPPSTRVYHLTTDGSHSYMVDGYAVAGGATEDDFDYDAWVSRA